MAPMNHLQSTRQNAASKVAIGHDLTVVAMLAEYRLHVYAEWKNHKVNKSIPASAHKQDSSPDRYLS